MLKFLNAADMSYNAIMKVTPWWMYVLVIAVGVGIGLLVRPLIQNSNVLGSSTPKADVRCPGPEGSELALSETLSSSFAGQTQTVSRTYLLERPGQVPLAFDGGQDSEAAPILCTAVAFGPGARISFARVLEVQIVEFLGPSVKRYAFSNDKTFSSFALEPKFKLGLKLLDYVPRGAPSIEEAGKRGRLELKRIKQDSAFPATLVFTTDNGGATWVFQK
jgi:hypothetical protein